MRWRVPSENVTARVVPEALAGETRSRASTRPLRYARLRRSPAQSRPTLPTKPARPPRAAKAKAKFVAFPPGRYENRPTRDWRSPVPLGGSGGVTMSRITSPTARASNRGTGVTPATGPASSAPRRRSCSPRAARTAGRRSSRARRGSGPAPPTRSTGTPRRGRTSEEVLQGQLLLRLLQLDALRGRLPREVLREQVRLHVPEDQGLLVPAVHLRDVRQGLRDPPRVVLPVGLELEGPPGDVRLHVHRGLPRVDHDPGDLHPVDDLVPELLQLASREDVRHRVRVHVPAVLFDRAGDHERLERVPLVRQNLLGDAPGLDRGDDLLRELHGRVDIVVEHEVEDELLGLALEVERVRPPDFVAPHDELALHGPRGLRGVPLLLPMAEERAEDPLELHVHVRRAEPLRDLPAELNGAVLVLVRGLHEDGVPVSVDHADALPLKLADHGVDVLPGERGDARADLRVREAVEGR